MDCGHAALRNKKLFSEAASGLLELGHAPFDPADGLAHATVVPIAQRGGDCRRGVAETTTGEVGRHDAAGGMASRVAAGRHARKRYWQVGFTCWIDTRCES